MNKKRTFLTLWIWLTLLLSVLVEYDIYYYRTPYEKIIKDKAFIHERVIYSAVIGAGYSLLLLGILSRFACKTRFDSGELSENMV